MSWDALSRPCPFPSPLSIYLWPRSHVDVAVYIGLLDYVSIALSCFEVLLSWWLFSLPEAELGRLLREDRWCVSVYICGTHAPTAALDGLI